MNFTIAKRRARVREWLREITKSVTDLVVARHIFKETTSIIQENDGIANTPSHFFDWMIRSHRDSIAIGIRAHVKINDESVLLMRFLHELRDYPDLITYENFCETWPIQPDVRIFEVEEETVSVDLAKLLGEERRNVFLKNAGALDRIDPRVIEADIGALSDSASSLEHYVDRRIAHFDQRGVTMSVPKWSQVDHSIQLLEGLVLRYTLLLEAVSLLGLLGTFQYDWKAIFRNPWIERRDR